MLHEALAPSGPDGGSGNTGAGVVTGVSPAALAPLLPLALAACGGGGAEPAAAPPAAAAPVPVVQAPVTTAQASRFLAQSTMGATRASVDEVVAQGFSKWIDAQFAMPRATTHWDWLVANNYVAGGSGTENGFDQTLWRQLIAEPDQLRQRVGRALLDFLVVGIGGVNLQWKNFAAAAYVDVLMDNAFGNYRQLLDAITFNPAMASFLTFLNNRKANATTGSLPDENYARELMQLFTLGLYQLNPDGSAKAGADGQPLETYRPADVSGLARVFTGLQLAPGSDAAPDRYRQRLTVTASINEAGASSFLGTTVTGGGAAAITAALDAIFAHPNIAPFVGRQLIQRLVTSNPSPAYVARVSAAFADNGQGTRGDMKAVIRAILLDPEARGDAGLASNTAGRQRDPVARLTGWARLAKVSSPSNAWAFGDTSNQSTRLGQSTGRSPTVFNFFRPGYGPPASAITAAGLVAPEFQVTNEQSVVAYVNYMQGLVLNGAGDAKPDYAELAARASDAAALVDEINLVLAAGQLSAATLATIRAAVDSVAATATNAATNRVAIALLLTLAAPEYLALR